jgi:hypothetical protein
MAKQQNTQTTGGRNHRNPLRITGRILKSKKWWILIAIVALMVFGCEHDVLNSVSDQAIPNNGREEQTNDDAFKMQDGSTFDDLVLQSDDVDDIISEAIIMSELPDWATRYFILNSAEIQGDRLSVTVSYAGGCRPHYFRLVSTKFLDYKPLQVNAQIFHFSKDDPCDSWITEDREFDLSPLKKLYFQLYEKTKGRIVINLIDAFASQEGAPLVYEFSDASRTPPPAPLPLQEYVNGTW